MQTRYSSYSALVLFILLTFSSTAQNANQSVVNILKKASEKLKNDVYYSYSTQYIMYYDYDSSKIKDSYTGFLLKKNNTYYYKIQNTEFVGFKGYSVMVSNNEKALMITKEGKQQFPLDLNSYMKGFNAKLINNVNSSEYICELVPSKVSQIMYSKIVLHISKIDYSILKQKLYFVNEVEEESKITKPRLEVIFKPRLKKQSEDDFLVSEKNYFLRIGKQIKVANRFKDYTLYKS